MRTPVESVVVLCEEAGYVAGLPVARMMPLTKLVPERK